MTTTIVRFYVYDQFAPLPGVSGVNAANSAHFWAPKEPYLTREVVEVNDFGGPFFTSPELSAPPRGLILRYIVGDGLSRREGVHYEVHTENSERPPASRHSPILTGQGFMNFAPGFRISLLALE